MATVDRRIDASRAEVWEVLSDGWRYSNWVVGTSHMRGVDPDWPAAGSQLAHASGIWPVVVRDTTDVVASEPAASLVLVAHGGLLGDARIDLQLTDDAGGTRVVMTEEPVSGPGRWLHGPVSAALIRARNVEALARLAALAEHRGAEGG